MPLAFVLFNTTIGTELQVLNDVKKIGGVEEAYVSNRLYDLIVRVKEDSIEALKELVTYHLRKIVNVTSTLTLIETE
jgi:DNA-binding Lrp family transcriptional regulator